MYVRFILLCRFTELRSVKCAVAGRLLFLRFRATTGDAMGMNMVSKVRTLMKHFMYDDE